MNMKRRRRKWGRSTVLSNGICLQGLTLDCYSLPLLEPWQCIQYLHCDLNVLFEYNFNLFLKKVLLLSAKDAKCSFSLFLRCP